MTNDFNGEGLMSLMHKEVLVMCASFFYEGVVVGVDNGCLILEGSRKKAPQIIFNSGEMKAKQFVEAEELPRPQWRIMIHAIESIG